MQIDFDQAKEFIHALTGKKDPVLCFQPIDDKSRNKPYVNFHSKLSAAKTKLEKLQTQGAGIFITLNETDGRGRKKANITYVRALFIDIDDYTDQRPPAFSIEAGRTGKRHFFWLPSEEIELTKFSTMQKMLADVFKSDPAVHDLPRVVRLPGTWNLKGKPEMHRLKKCTSKRFKIEEIIHPGAFAFAQFLNRQKSVDAGKRNPTLYKLAAEGRNLGVPEKMRLQLLTHFNDAKVEPPLEADELRLINKNAGKYAEVENRHGPADDFAVVSDAPESPQGEESDASKSGKYWRGWAWVAATNSFFDLKTLEDYGTEQFNNLHYHRMDKKSDRPAHYVLSNQLIERFETIVYAPGKEKRLPGDRLKRLNLYRAPDLEPKKGDLKWFYDHLNYLIPEEREKQLFMDWLAYSVKFPGEKIHYALVLQGRQGIGKSYFKQLYRRMLGESNVIEPHSDSLKSRFNGFLKRGQIVIIEELMLGGMEGGVAINRLKQWITEDRLMIEEKGRNVVNMENKFNLFCLTNFRDALRLDENDRRFFVIFSQAHHKTPAYYERLFRNLGERAAALKHYLINEHDFSREFKPKGRAPTTKAKSIMIENSRSAVETWLLEHIENKQAPFAADIVSVTDILELEELPDALQKIPRLANEIGQLLRRNGAEQIGRKRIGDRQLRLWAVRNTEKWLNASDEEIRKYLDYVQSEFEPLEGEFNGK